MTSKTGGRYAKRRGDTYEREVAQYLNDYLFAGTETVYRAPLSGGGRQFGNGGGSADLVGLPHIWAELKRTNAFSPYAAMAQAETGINARRSCSDVPVAITRRDGIATDRSLVVMRLSDWAALYDAFLTVHGYKRTLHGTPDQTARTSEAPLIGASDPDNPTSP